MKVVHVTRLFWPSIGGLEEAVLNLAVCQRRGGGIDASVVSLDRLPGQAAKLPSRDTVQGVPVTRVPWRGSRRYPLAPGVLAHIRDADLVHVHGIDFFFDFLAWTKPLHRRRLVASTHGGFFHTRFLATLKQLYFTSVTRTSTAFYERIVACSEADALIFKPVAGTKLATIENGVDIDKFRDQAAREHTKTLISFGRLASHKRIPALFALLRELRVCDAEWQLIVAGGEADVTLSSLQDEARRAGVADAVRFVREPSNRELTELIGTASYFACLSAYEGFGIAAVEAMSAGLILVLSPISPFTQLVRNARLGVIVDPDNPEEAAQRLLLASRAMDRSYDATRASSVEAASAYCWASASEAYLRIYRAVTAENFAPATGERPPVPAVVDHRGKDRGSA
jgi:alpha-1,3-mannosyltransferase